MQAIVVWRKEGKSIVDNWYGKYNHLKFSEKGKKSWNRSAKENNNSWRQKQSESCEENPRKTTVRTISNNLTRNIETTHQQ